MSLRNWSVGTRALSTLLFFWLVPVGAQSSAQKSAPVKAETPTPAAVAPAEQKSTPAPVPESKSASTPAKTEEKKPASPELLQRIRDALRFGNSQQVRDALNTLGRLGVEEQKTLLPELKEACKSHDGLVLRKLAEFIGNVQFNDLDDELARFLADKTHEQLFFATVAAIAKKKPASALPVLIKEIREQDFSKPGNRIPDAVHLLTVYKDNSLQPFLVEKLTAADTYADYRSGILKYLAETVPWSQELKEKVLKLFQDESEPLTVRGSAAYALGKAQISEARPVLKEALTKIDNLKSFDEKKRYTRFRMQVIAGLILLKDNDVRDILYAMARDDDEQVRVRAIYQIGKLKIAEARELLAYKAKYDPSARVQKEAKKALSLLDGQKTESEELGKEP